MKLLGFDEDFACEAHANVREMINNVVLPTSTSEWEKAAAKPLNKHCHTEASVLKFLLGSGSAMDTASSELDRYIAYDDPAANEEESMLDWWRRNVVTFPKCAHLARKNLAIPATPEQSERLFSAIGRPISKTRSRLLPENADCIRI